MGKVGDETVIEVLTTKMGVTSCGFYFEDAFLDGEKRNIKCSTARIEDEDVLLACDVLLIKAIGNNGSSRLIDDTKDIKTSNLTSILSCLTLSIVEVSRDSDDGVPKNRKLKN